MSTKHAVIGLLLERRGYGYDLVQRLSGRLGPAWQLKPSSVYTALDELEREGLVRGTLRELPDQQSDRVARRSVRVVYDVTPEGSVAFRTWIAQSADRREPIRSELHLKLALARPADVEALLEALAHEERLAHQLYEECQEIGSDRRADLVRAGAKARLRADMTWFDAVRDLLESIALGDEQFDASSR